MNDLARSGHVAAHAFSGDEKQRAAKAPYRKIAVAARRIIVAHGRPMSQSEIEPLLSRDLRACIGPRRLGRILRRSKRAGLLLTDGKWWLRKPWLTKQDKPWIRQRSRSKLAASRVHLKAACEHAIHLLMDKLVPMSVGEMIAKMDDPEIYAELLRRAIGNRLGSNHGIVRVSPGVFQWCGASQSTRASSIAGTRDGSGNEVGH